MQSLLNEKNVVYILIYCWPDFKELMELENGLFLSTLSTASLLCTLVLQGLFYTLANN